LQPALASHTNHPPPPACKLLGYQYRYKGVQRLIIKKTGGGHALSKAQFIELVQQLPRVEDTLSFAGRSRVELSSQLLAADLYTRRQLAGARRFCATVSVCGFVRWYRDPDSVLVVDPASAFAAAWHAVTTLGIVYSALVLPARAAFDFDVPFALDCALEVWFLADCWLHLHLGYRDRK
jgi:hypothetical protein